MDDWDPEFVARLSTERRVIRFDNLGIGESSGETPNTVRGMAEVVPQLLDAVGIDAVDLLGWSIGGYVGQTIALTWPERVRRLVIAGSGSGGPDGPPLIHGSRRSLRRPRRLGRKSSSCSSREPKLGPQPLDGISIAFVSGSARPLRRNPVADSARRSCHGGRGMEQHGRISAS
jgi:pimeloyl-ACP methyl ester carboxylesterase